MPPFRQIGDDVYTCVAPPGYEKDPAVTRAIHSFDPGVIPFWLLQRWSIEGRERTIVYHGVGRYYPNPRQLRRHFHVSMPAGADFPAPNFLDAVFCDQNTVDYYRGGPSVPWPWDWNVYYWMRSKFETLTVKAYEARVAEHLARIVAMVKAHEDDLAYRKKQLEPWIMKQLERVSDRDWQQLRERQHRIAVARRLGMPPERLREPKPFIRIAAVRSAKPIAPWSPRGAETYGWVAPAQGERS